MQWWANILTYWSVRRQRQYFRIMIEISKDRNFSKKNLKRFKPKHRPCTFGGLISWKGTRERGNPRNKLNKSPKTNVTKSGEIEAAKIREIYTSQSHQQLSGVKFPPTDICSKWNVGHCQKAAGSCTNFQGQALRHVCNHRDLSNPNSAPCGQAHMRRGNHQRSFQ